MPLISGRDPNHETKDIAVDEDGRLEINESPTSSYKLSDMETGGVTEYYGYMRADGSWYIMQLTSTAARYAAGTLDYAANWTARGGLSYDYFSNVF